MVAGPSSDSISQMVGNGKGKSPLFSLVNGVGLGDKIQLNETEAYLILDTRRFSSYSISSLDMVHSFGTGNPNNPTVPYAAHTLKVIDTTGLTFFNLLMDILHNKIQTNASSAFFLLAISFMGHTDDGLTETISTTFIPLTLLTIGFSVDSKGSEYEIQMMEMEGTGFGEVANLKSLGTLSSISSDGKSNTLNGMISALEDQLNIQSLDFFQKYNNIGTNAAKQSTGSSTGSSGKLVQYMITIPEEWRNFKLDTPSKSNHTEQIFTAVGKAETANANATAGVTYTTELPVSAQPPTVDTDYFTFSFSKNDDITTAIKKILESSNEILIMGGKDRRETSTNILNKTVISTTSDETTFCIHFDVYPHNLAVPKNKNLVTKLVAGTNSGNTLTSQNQVIPNLIVYDYLFTGFNSHVKTLNVSYSPMSTLGLLNSNYRAGKSGFNQVGAKGQNIKDVESVTSGPSSTDDYAPQLLPGDPIFFPMETTDKKKNNQTQKTEDDKNPEKKYADLQEYSKTLAFAHFVSTMEATITVRGNPNIIAKYADADQRGGIPPHFKILSRDELSSLIHQSDNSNPEKRFNDTLKTKVQSAKDLYYNGFVSKRINGPKNASSTDALEAGGDVTIAPVYVKINIKVPDTDYTGEFKVGKPMFSDKFFYDGLYQILIINTTFNNGEFEHQLHLIPSSERLNSDTTSTPIKKTI
jgi:hypothetical protein